MPELSLQQCPCGSGLTFGQCCEKFINATKFPESPEQLMRSRYSAYVIQNTDYLFNSWHVTTRPESLDLNNNTTQWKKLTIIAAAENTVQFVAFFERTVNELKKIFCLAEKSHFIKESNWFYHSGEALHIFEVTKNMSCPCGSENKFKRCCGSNLDID